MSAGMCERVCVPLGSTVSASILPPSQGPKMERPDHGLTGGAVALPRQLHVSRCLPPAGVKAFFTA